VIAASITPETFRPPRLHRRLFFGATDGMCAALVLALYRRSLERPQRLQKALVLVICPMPTKIILAWSIDTAGTTLSPTQAITVLEGVDLYEDEDNDAVLGQLFGLSVEDDDTQAVGPIVTRTLTLNMFKDTDSESAPPPFPCHPRTDNELPFQLRQSELLSGVFVPVTGSVTVATSQQQVSTLSIGDEIRFASQSGVLYTVAGVSATAVTLGVAFTGKTGNTSATKEALAPVALDRAAVYSTSDLDTDGVATVPAIASGSGARTVVVHYLDSTGAGPFEAEADLTGKRPVLLVPDGPAGEDIATIVAFFVEDVGDFENSVGQITFAELSGPLPDIRPDATPEQFYGPVTDEAQLLIGRHLAYLPPSFFALAQPGAAATQLEGDFVVTTGSVGVPTTEDQSAVLSPGDEIEFVAQKGTRYEVSTVTAKSVFLTEAYSGIDDNFTGENNQANVGTKGNLGTAVTAKLTGASLVPAPAAPPTNAQLAALLAEYSLPMTAVPPPFPPLSPMTIPTPTFLSGLYARTIQLKLAGVPVVSEEITFA